MKRLSKDQIQDIELNILLQLKKVCDFHHLKLYLSGGTLLGAIRHHGFIPWDDDIDVCIPRPDYNKLIHILHQKNSMPNYLSMVCYEDGNFEFPFMKIFDKRTEFRRQYIDDGKNSSLWIDVFPVDGLPEDRTKIKKIYRQVDKYRKYLMKSKAKPHEGKTPLRKTLKPLYLFLVKTFYNPQKCAKKIYLIANNFSYEEADYVGAVTWGLYGIGECMKKNEFEKPVDVMFEGYCFQAMSCWDSYLIGLYGNYMQLPPKEKRITHDMEVWAKQNIDQI